MGGVKLDEVLAEVARQNLGLEAEAALARLPRFPLNLGIIKMVMINEVAAEDPGDDFYGTDNSEYLASTRYLFEKAGLKLADGRAFAELGIYLTNALKTPKIGTVVDPAALRQQAPLLGAELKLFPDLKVIMLMGDVAKKAMNLIAKSETGKPALPSGSTYKLRHESFFYKGLRLMPAYIMTGPNLRIEKSKTEMNAEEIAKMLAIIQGRP